jgi:hypothetical protein
MEINSVTFIVGQYEVPFCSVIRFNILEASARERGPQRRYILLLHNDVEIGMRPCLLAEQCINAPASVDPHSDVKILCNVEKSADIARRNLRRRLLWFGFSLHHHKRDTKPRF